MVRVLFAKGVKGGIVRKIQRRLTESGFDTHGIDGTSERDLREIVANAVADKAKPEFRADVRSRKLTIAVGSGKVHGGTFVLRNWGLDEFAFGQ